MKRKKGMKKIKKIKEIKEIKLGVLSKENKGNTDESSINENKRDIIKEDKGDKIYY